LLGKKRGGGAIHFEEKDHPNLKKRERKNSRECQKEKGGEKGIIFLKRGGGGISIVPGREGGTGQRKRGEKGDEFCGKKRKEISPHTSTGQEKERRTFRKKKEAEIPTLGFGKGKPGPADGGGKKKKDEDLWSKPGKGGKKGHYAINTQQEGEKPSGKRKGKENSS